MTTTEYKWKMCDIWMDLGSYLQDIVDNVGCVCCKYLKSISISYICPNELLIFLCWVVLSDDLSLLSYDHGLVCLYFSFTDWKTIKSNLLLNHKMNTKLKSEKHTEKNGICWTDMKKFMQSMFLQVHKTLWTANWFQHITIQLVFICN